MSYFKTVFLITKLICLFLTSILLSLCNNTTQHHQPTVNDYTVGEKWVWKYKGITKKGEVRSNGEDAREIIILKNGLAMVIAKDTILLTDIVKPETSKTPRYKWPLKVGKNWRFENSWTSQDGTKGKESLDAKVLSYKEEKVKAGTFMAYTIVYKGTISNSRGFTASNEEVWLYAPEIKNFIKMTQTQGDFLYTEELVKYSKPSSN